MRKVPRSLGVALIIVAAVGGAAAWGSLRSAPDPYAALRQSRVQVVPGSFGYVLEPPGDVGASVDPTQAYEGLVGASPQRDVSLTLAIVRDRSQNISYGPAWVYVTHDLCYFTAKGDFIGPSRSGKKTGCTQSNLLIQMIDVHSGAALGVFEGFDPSNRWLPEREGTPDQSLGTTRFH